jgi:hypothetical protein
MKAILEFDLPEEKETYRIYNNAWDNYLSLCAIDDIARRWLKYGGCPHKTVEEVLEWVRAEMPDLHA